MSVVYKDDNWRLSHASRNLAAQFHVGQRTCYRVMSDASLTRIHTDEKYAF